jgi:general secretion pathway protein J
VSRRSTRTRQAGFTLLEVMLALAILGFITATLWGSFSRTAYVKQRTEAAQDRVHAARVAMMRMSREIEMAFLGTSDNPALVDRRTMFIGVTHNDADELRFSWFGHQRLRADTPEADTALVMYYTEPDPDNRQRLNLMRRETRRLEQKDPTTIPGESYVLCPGITRLKFSYYDYKKKEWREDWNTMGADGLQYLPTHVRVTLGILDERGQEQLYTSAARVIMTERVDYRPKRS